jgi:hypothetical protein
MDLFLLRPKDTSTLTTKRCNFRLNYNPYSLQRSADANCDKRQLKQIRMMALENAQGKPLQKTKFLQLTVPQGGDNEDDKSDYENKKGKNIFYILFRRKD